MCFSAIFERLRSVLHEGQLEQRVQYMVEVMFAVRKDGFKVSDLTLPIRDLARTRAACLLDRQFHEKFLFGQTKFSMKNFQF